MKLLQELFLGLGALGIGAHDATAPKAPPRPDQQPPAATAKADPTSAPKVDSVQGEVDLFERSTLTVGQSGAAKLERTVDPRGDITIGHADRFTSVDAIPLRTNDSDIVVRETSMRAAEAGFDARMAHYAKHQGTVSIGDRCYTVSSYQGGIATLKDGDAYRRVNLNQVDAAVRFGDVKPAFVERTSPSVAFKLARHSQGPEALRLVGSLPVTGKVSYRVTIADPRDQHNIRAELNPRLEIANPTDVDFKNLSLSFRLNEPQPVRPMADGVVMMRAAAAPIAPGSAPDLGTSEGSSSGVLTMTIRSGTFGLDAGETRTIGFAPEVNGTPKEDMDFVPVTLNQSLKLDYAVGPGEIGKAQETTQSPRSSYTLSPTAEARPAGQYEVYDGADLAASLRTAVYTDKQKELALPSGTLKAIEGKSSTVANNVDSSAWEDVVQPGAVAKLPVANKTAQFQRRTNTYDMAYTLNVESKSAYDRDVEVTISAGAFDKGISKIQASVARGEMGVRALPLAVSYDEKAKTISFHAPVGANSRSRVIIGFTGQQTETRNAGE